MATEHCPNCGADLSKPGAIEADMTYYYTYSASLEDGVLHIDASSGIPDSHETEVLRCHGCYKILNDTSVNANAIEWLGKEEWH